MSRRTSPRLTPRDHRFIRGTGSPWPPAGLHVAPVIRMPRRMPWWERVLLVAALLAAGAYAVVALWAVSR